ncbi:PHD/YefM family antitoxin component YafN of YafNO toxin-antitoxin module [Saccharopolyspora lacisalsi]|uniref:PHD/YefM family antitoxin component YafN of YafNO toxin-antitoxin module n=1 Tax=Halosaccharopolyspora lacisalsi TaxID=1000566 RepID=A0A839DZI8_9PSEU|nr:type II toxin-antitoxin system Phd/YefM family antitoxin [Halosaccharopolyspora lacisalsi]MBA8826924.1 PHD/YefM family antitoxin component YafN of YafNO toxin-antitoxin module [Halosaccharopolyspora lacisalsi]
MTTLPLSEAKAHLSEIVESTVRTRDHVHVTRNLEGMKGILEQRRAREGDE